MSSPSDFDTSLLSTGHSIKPEGSAEAGASVGTAHYLTDRMLVLLRSIVQQCNAYVNAAI
jgi:hypothetical protein